MGIWKPPSSKRKTMTLFSGCEREEETRREHTTARRRATAIVASSQLASSTIVGQQGVGSHVLG